MVSDLCKRQPCAGDAEWRGKYNGYCSLECRDLHEVEMALDGARAEIAKLRPVVEAAREVDAWMGDERWQLGDAPNKALDALEQALAALDAGEDGQ